MNRYIPASKLRPWNISADGEQWFEFADESLPEIHGTPRTIQEQLAAAAELGFVDSREDIEAGAVIQGGASHVRVEDLTEAELAELTDYGFVYLEGRGLFKTWSTDSAGVEWVKRVDADDSGSDIAARKYPTIKAEDDEDESDADDDDEIEASEFFFNGIPNTFEDLDDEADDD